MAASENFYLFSTGPSIFVLNIYLSCKEIFSLVKFSSRNRCFFNFLISVSRRGGSRTPVETKIEFFVTTTNESKALTVITKNFILDATVVLDPPLSRLQYDRRYISPSQCFHQALHPLCFSCTKSHNNAIMLEQSSRES